MTAKQDPAVSLNLEPDVALVLFDFLSRTMMKRNGADLHAVVQHDSELWSLELLLGHLETTLVPPFRADYVDLLAGARERLVERCGTWPT